jgi:hypothetical protein
MQVLRFFFLFRVDIFYFLSFCMEERRGHTRALEAWVKANGVGKYPLAVHDFGDADADQGRATLALRPIKAPRPFYFMFIFT